MKEQYTRAEIIAIIDALLQYPDMLIDAYQNENTSWSAEELLDMVEDPYTQE